MAHQQNDPRQQVLRRKTSRDPAHRSPERSKPSRPRGAHVRPGKPADGGSDATRRSRGTEVVHQIRGELMAHLGAVIRRRRLSGARAAQLLGISESRLSDLKSGKVDEFSIDVLQSMLATVGVQVTFAVDSDV